MKHLLPSLLVALVLHADPSVWAAPAALAWEGETVDTWHGYKRHVFTIDGCKAWIVEPKQARPGNPWTWCMEFPDAFTERTGVPRLLEEGFFHLHIEVGNTFGCPAALKHFDAFHAAITTKGLAAKGTLIGISRGGLYAYNWASRNPDKVVCIYGDAPVCDFKSWPGGKGKGRGSAGDWKSLIQYYGFKDEAEALAWKGNPVDQLEPLAKARVPLIHVVGDADDVVPVAENTAIVEQRYQALGGTINVFHKPGVGHHPHGLDDPKPLVELILRYTAAGAKASPPKRPDREVVVLLHGLARTHRSMNRMEEALTAAGYTVHSMSYASTKKTVSRIAEEDLAPLLAQCQAAKPKKIHFVAHSMGNIVLRQYFATHALENAGRMVMLGPPNQGSEVVDKLGPYALYNWINGPAGQQLGTSSNSLPNRLPAPPIEVGVVAGTASINWFLSTLIPGVDDGKVAVARTKLPGMKDFALVDVAHPFLMQDAKVIRMTLSFLQDGCFETRNLTTQKHTSRNLGSPRDGKDGQSTN